MNRLKLCSKHEVNNPYIVIVDESKCDWCNKELESIYQELGRILGKVDYKREMEISRDKYIK